MTNGPQERPDRTTDHAETATRPEDGPGEVLRFREVAELSDAGAALSPYEREHFTISFDSHEDYESWKNDQTNPWNW